MSPRLRFVRAIVSGVVAVLVLATVAGGVTVDPDLGATYVPLSPARILDTRFGTGLSGPFQALTPRTFQVTGLGGVPASAVAVTGNLTATAQTQPGFVFLGPDPIASPTSSTLNFPLGDTRANGVTVALSATGTLSATFGYSGSTHLIFDVTGYFIPASVPTGYEVVSVTVTLADDNAKTFVTVECPAGKVPLSGGWRDEFFAGGGSYGPAGEVNPLASYPTATGWSFIYWDPYDVHDVTFFVVCAPFAP